MPSTATRVPVRLAGQLPQAPHVSLIRIMTCFSWRPTSSKPLGFRRQVGFFQTEITTISGSTSFCTCPQWQRECP